MIQDTRLLELRLESFINQANALLQQLRNQRQQQPPHPSPHHETATRAASHPDNPIPAAQLAAWCQIGPRHLSRILTAAGWTQSRVAAGRRWHKPTNLGN